jgi:hypothetical protein
MALQLTQPNGSPSNVATKKQKRTAGIAKREAEEAERRESGLRFLRLSQAERAEQRGKAEEDRKNRAIAKSKRLARAHEAAKSSKPGTHKTVGELTDVSKASPKNKRRKQYQKARGPKQEVST